METRLMTHDEIDDDVPTPRIAAEIPTLPSAIAIQTISEPATEFDSETERFFASSSTSSLDAAAILAGYALDEEISAWWVGQRRRTFSRWVAGIMAVCALLLAAGAR